MPLPRQLRWAVPFYQPEKVEEHAQNVRSLERALNDVPVFPLHTLTTAAAGAGGTTSLANTSATISPFNGGASFTSLTFKKRFDWTDIWVTISLAAYVSAAVYRTITHGFKMTPQDGTAATNTTVFRQDLGNTAGIQVTGMGALRSSGWPTGVYTVDPIYFVDVGSNVLINANSAFVFTIQEILPVPTGSDV